MYYIETVILATLQGLLEFLPISSSGHVFLATRIFGWDDRGSLFDAVIHVGALSAILIYFSRVFISINPLKQWRVAFDKADASTAPRLLVLLVVAVTPLVGAGLLYFTFRDQIDTVLRTGYSVGAALMFTGAVLFATNFVRRNQLYLDDIAVKNAAFIGLAQVLSIVPGISRSGMVISMGLFNRLTYVTAARFSFLLAIPTLLGTAIALPFEGFSDEVNINWIEYLVAFLVSAITALISIYATLFVLRRALLLPIAIYAIIVGSVVISLSFAFPERFG